jgi:ParB family transcriptional regulator, chromosome partitioning protein
MAAHPRGLGRGLGALFHDMNTTSRNGAEVRMIPLAEITPNPHQPRQTFPEESLKELAHSIRSQGVLQPILVRPGKPEGTFELIAGERRLRACVLAQLELIPALVRDISDEESIAIALIENLQREDLNPLEEAFALGRLKDQLGLSQEELATRVGRSRPAVANALRLLQLTPDVQEDVRAVRITAGHARAIVALPDGGAQIELSRRVQSSGLTVRQTEELAARYKKLGSFAVRSREKAVSDTPFHQTLKHSLSLRFPCTVKCSGDQRKGSITLSYGSADEFKTLLARLGLDGGMQG